MWIVFAGLRAASRAGNQGGKPKQASGESLFWLWVVIIVVVAGAAVEYPVFRWIVFTFIGFVVLCVLGALVYTAGQAIAHRNDQASARKRAEDDMINSVINNKTTTRGNTR